MTRHNLQSRESISWVSPSNSSAPGESDRPGQKILILNQTFYPDVASTAQHAADLASALAERGHHVTAVASTRCYDNPSVTYGTEETWKNVTIKRIWSSGFGKRAKWRRAVDFASFLAGCVWRIATLDKQDVVVTMTSPPLISVLGALLVRLRGGRLVFWVMDLNPDEAIAAGWLKADSGISFILQKLLNFSIRSADGIIALDRFMAERLLEKGARPDSLSVLPPWSHSETVGFNEEGRAAFRRANGLEGKFVVMYSGNHSPCHPLQTLLDAARRMRAHTDVAFAFIGGGSEFKTVQEFAAHEGLSNIVCLPYQPIESLSASLSAADLHCVVMGDPFVGMVHPCKVYNILALGTPLLYVGPSESHIADIGETAGSGWFYSTTHGDAGGVVDRILRAKEVGALQVEGERRIAAEYGQKVLLVPHVAIVEKRRTHLEDRRAAVSGRYPGKSNIGIQMENKTNEQ